MKKLVKKNEVENAVVMYEERLHDPYNPKDGTCDWMQTELKY